jgi:hypothetical protein
MLTNSLEILLADRIWIAVALLHRELPNREDFSKDEIRRKLQETDLATGTKPGSVSAHLKEHLIANVHTTSTKYIMMYETRPGFLRLFRPGDFVDQCRQSRPAKQVPRKEQLPLEYQSLLDWYETWSKQHPSPEKPNWQDDPLIRLIGSGHHIWADEHADEYVENLRREEA